MNERVISESLFAEKVVVVGAGYVSVVLAIQLAQGGE